MVATIPVPRVRRWHDPSAPRFDPRGLRSRRPCRPEWLTSYRADGSRSALEVRENGSASPADALTFEDDPLGRPYLVKRGTTTLTDYTWSPDGTLAARADAGVGTTAYGYAPETDGVVERFNESLEYEHRYRLELPTFSRSPTGPRRTATSTTRSGPMRRSTSRPRSAATSRIPGHTDPSRELSGILDS
jgi:hypothetical protein